MHQRRQVGGRRVHLRARRSEVQKLNPDSVVVKLGIATTQLAYEVKEANAERGSKVGCLEVLLDLLLHA